MYRVLSTLCHDGHDYAPGATLALPPEAAATLIDMEVVEPVGAAAPASQDSLLPDYAEPTTAPLVNLATATLAELMALPKVGEAKANALMAARPLATLADAQAALSLSANAWEAVAPLVTL